MIDIGELREKVGEFGPLMSTPEGAITYSVTQLVNFLREQHFDIPVKSTAEQILTIIRDIAHDPVLHIKLLDKKWTRDLIRTFFAKNDDQEKIFNRMFEEIMQITAAKSAGQKNINDVFAYAGGLIAKNVRGFSNDYEFSNPQRRSAKYFISALNDELARAGFDPKESPAVIDRAGGKKSDTAILDSLEKSFNEAVAQQIDQVIKRPLTSAEYQAFAASGEVPIKKFTEEDFNDDFMVDVLERTYMNKSSQEFDAVVTKFLYKQKASGMAAGKAKTGSSKAEPNMLFGAFNEYLAKIHGSEIPEIYAFPFKEGTEINDEIKSDAAKDTIRLTMNEITWDRLKKEVLPTKYSNLIRRTMYVKSISDNIMNRLQGIGHISINFTFDDLVVLADLWAQQSMVTEKSLETGRESVKKEDTSRATSKIYSDAEKVKKEDIQTAVYRGKTEAEIMYLQATQILLSSIKDQNITWTFKTGPNAGKTVKIASIEDFRRYAQELRGIQQERDQKVHDEISTGMKDALAGKGSFLTRKDIRELKELLATIPDPSIPRRVDKLVGDGKFGRDLREKIKQTAGSSPNKAARTAVESAVDKMSFSPDEIKALRERLSAIGAKSAVKRLDSAVTKGSAFTRPEIDEISDLLSRVPEESSRQFWNAFKGSKIPADKLKSVKDAAARMEDESARQKIMPMLGAGSAPAKNVAEAIQAAGEIQDQQMQQSIQRALSSMKMSDADARKIKDRAGKAGELPVEKAVDKAISRGGVTAGDIRPLIQAASRAKDDKVKKALSAAINKAEFSGDMDSISDLAGKIKDKKTRERMEGLVGKKITPDKIAAVSDAVRNAKGNGAREEAGRSLDGIEVEPESIDAVEKAADKIDHDYVRKKIKELIGQKQARIPGSAFDKILQDTPEALSSQSVIDEIRDKMDEKAFSAENISRVQQAAKRFGTDPAVQKISDLVNGADGKEISPDEEEKIGEMISQIPDDSARDRAGKILAGAKSNAGVRQQETSVGDPIKELEAALDEASGGLSRGAWELGRDTVEWMKRTMNEIKNGADPSKLFGKMDDGIDLKLAVTRMAKQANTDKMMVKWFDAFFKMFNNFAKNASDSTQQAMFSSIANNMNVNSEKMKLHVKKVDISPELKKATDEVNEHNTAVKEETDRLMGESAAWYAAHGMDISEVMQQKIVKKIRESQEGSRLIPVPGSTRIVFDSKPSRSFLADFSVKPKRRLLFPDLEEIRTPSEFGNSPAAFPEDIVNDAVDEYNKSIETMGNVADQGPPKGGGEVGGGGFQPPPDMRLLEMLKNLKKTTVRDVKRDIGRRMMDSLMRAVSPRSMNRAAGQTQEIADPKDPLNIEGNIDIPSFGSEAASGKSMNIQQAGMPFKAPPGAGGRPGGQAPSGAGQPVPAPARGSASSMCQKGACRSRVSGNRPGGPKEVQVGLDGSPIKKGERIYDDDTVVDHRKAGGPGGDPASWYPEGTSPEKVARLEAERAAHLERESEDRRRKLDELQGQIDKLSKKIKSPLEDVLPESEQFASWEGPMKDVHQKVSDIQERVRSGADDIESEIYKPMGIMNPKDFLKPGAVISKEEIDKMLKINAQKPENAAMMRKLFQLAMRNDYSTITRLKAGRRKLSTIDLNATARRNLRHGINPSNGRLNVTSLTHRHAKNIKRDIFVADISGSMHTFIAMTGQLLASLADPKFLSVVLFDTDATEIDKNVFMNNPSAIFQSPEATTKFAEAAVDKNKDKRERLGLSTKWSGIGSTSYDMAAGLLSKMNPNKGDRIIIIGDLEHNTIHYRKELDELKNSGACTTDFECIAAWYREICKKADSCIVLNPKAAPGSDLTCEMLDYDIPTCLVGAMNEDQSLTGAGLMRTVQCLKQGMTGQRPKISQKVLDQCKGQARKDKLENRAKIDIEEEAP